MKQENERFSNHSIWKFTGKWTALRLIGSVCSSYEFWIPIETMHGPATIRKLCLDWDPKTHSFTKDICPYRKAGIPGRPVYFSNAIIRELQEAETTDARKANIQCPVRVLRIPPRLQQNLTDLSLVNRSKNKSGKLRSFELAHPKFGCDVKIKANPKTPYSYYDVKRLERTRLTDDELQYEQFSLVLPTETLDQAKAAWKKLNAKVTGI